MGKAGKGRTRADVLIAGEERPTCDICCILSKVTGECASAYGESDVRKKAGMRSVQIIVFDGDSYEKDLKERSRVLTAIRESGKPFIVVSSSKSPDGVEEAFRLGAADYIIRPYNEREFITRFNAALFRKMRISCLGGGTGLFNLLMGLKDIRGSLLTSIVSTADDGGSSGRLKEEFGILPPGDIRRSLVALSNAPDLMNRVLQYRFDKGQELKGHNFGNLFLTVLAQIKGSIVDAAKDLANLLYIHGMVIPIADTRTTLCAEFEDGTIIKGESNIDLGKGRGPDLHIKRLWHEPEQQGDINACSCILNSDIVIIGPGDLFTSVITNLIIKNIREAVVKTRAKKVYICNLMTKPGETAHYDACRHVKEVVDYLGSDCLDYVILSNTKLSSDAIREYAKEGQSPVGLCTADRLKKITKASLIIADVSHETELVRHDSAKLRSEIMKIIARENR